MSVAHFVSTRHALVSAGFVPAFASVMPVGRKAWARHPRALNKDEQEIMAKIVSSFVTLSERTKKPMKLLKLERHRTRDEEIVNGAVLTRHEILLTKIFTSFPRGPPSKSSVACALRDGANAVCDDHRDVMPPSRFAWSRDEAEKLF